METAHFGYFAPEVAADILVIEIRMARRNEQGTYVVRMCPVTSLSINLATA